MLHALSLGGVLYARCHGLPQRFGQNRKKDFFFEKKKQKTFAD
jgi:hypothetical protein